MTVTDQINRWLNRKIEARELRPGDKLPSYSKICSMFNVSYATASRALKNMETAGRIQIENGVGAFLRGDKTLKVNFYLCPTSIPPQELLETANEISAANDLHLEFSVSDKKYLETHLCPAEKHDVSIVEYDPWYRLNGSLMDYSSFRDYEPLMNEFDVPDEERNNFALPFYRFTYAGLVNRDLLKRCGFTGKIQRFGKLEFWEELVRCCRRHGIHPALREHVNAMETIWDFPMRPVAELLLAESRDTENDIFASPAFASPVGTRIFEVIANMDRPEPGETMFHNAALVFAVGSWIASQYRGIPELADGDFEVIAGCSRNRRLLRYQDIFLQTVMPRQITVDEKQRIWTLLGGLLSKPVQMRLAARTGFLSMRKDISMEEHGWADRPDFANFFPVAGDILLPHSLLSMQEIAALAAIQETAECFRLDSGKIGALMDGVLARHHIDRFPERLSFPSNPNNDSKEDS